MYAIVPAIDGVPQIGTVRLINGISISETEAVVHVEGELQEGWTELTEAEYQVLVPPAPQPSSPEPTLAEKVDALGMMLVQLMLKGGS
jgi:hypothetical protein